jgi:hypothetical protein
MGDDAATLRDTDPLAWLLACEDIRQLASRYAVLTGQRNFAALAGLFVPDVRVRRGVSGHAALQAFFEEQQATLGMAILSVGNHVIDVRDAHHASGIVGTRAEVVIDGRLVIQQVEYHDTYERRAGVWLFARRTHRLWYAAPFGESPLGLPPANWPEHHIGMGDLP